MLSTVSTRNSSVILLLENRLNEEPTLRRAFSPLKPSLAFLLSTKSELLELSAKAGLIKKRWQSRYIIDRQQQSLPSPVFFVLQ